MSTSPCRSVGVFRHGFTVPTRHPVANTDSNGTRISNACFFVYRVAGKQHGFLPPLKGVGFRLLLL